MPKLSRQEILDKLRDDYPLAHLSLDVSGFKSDLLHLGEVTEKDVEMFFRRENNPHYYEDDLMW